MSPKEAIDRAKIFLQDIFEGEDVKQVRLEEVVRDTKHDGWLITFGLLRPSGRERGGPLGDIMASGMLRRSFKTVVIPDNTEEYPSIRIREATEE